MPSNGRLLSLRHGTGCKDASGAVLPAEWGHLGAGTLSVKRSVTHHDRAVRFPIDSTKQDRDSWLDATTASDAARPGRGVTVGPLTAANQVLSPARPSRCGAPSAGFFPLLDCRKTGCDLTPLPTRSSLTARSTSRTRSGKFCSDVLVVYQAQSRGRWSIERCDVVACSWRRLLLGYCEPRLTGSLCEPLSTVLVSYPRPTHSRPRESWANRRSRIDDFEKFPASPRSTHHLVGRCCTRSRLSRCFLRDEWWPRVALSVHLTVCRWLEIEVASVLVRRPRFVPPEPSDGTCPSVTHPTLTSTELCQSLTHSLFIDFSILIIDFTHRIHS